MFGLIDIGGTQIKYGWFDQTSQQLIDTAKLLTATHLANFKMEDRLAIVIEHLMNKGSLSGIGISTAGVVDSRKGTIVYANQNIPNYTGTPLKSWVEATYHLPCSVENDVNCALLGEVYYGGYPKNYQNAFMLTIGTGVGGAVMINGEIYHGASDSSGEVGYSIINGQNIEKLASTTALVDRIQRQFPDQQLNGFKIFQQAKEGNDYYISVIDEMMNHLMILINNAVSLLNPELVILGGGIMEQTDYLRPLVDEKFNQLFHNEFAKQATTIDFAKLGNRAGLLGAYKHFLLTHS